MKRKINNNIPKLLKDILNWNLDFHEDTIDVASNKFKIIYARESDEALEAIIEANKQSIVMGASVQQLLMVKIITLEDMLRVRKGLRVKGEDVTRKRQNVTADLATTNKKTKHK